MDKVRLSINNKLITVDQGTTILEAALKNGIYIPHLCHHRELDPIGACRLCVVEIDNWKTAISCKTSVKEKMIVKTETPEINKIRQIALELLIADHDMNCLACTKNTKCKLQIISNHVGVDEKRLARLKPRENRIPIDDSNPFFNFDPNRCVLCGICVRTCDELQNVFAIDFAYRGLATKVSGFGDKTRIESVCESCGECVVRCPVGALTVKDAQNPIQNVKSVCSFCGCGCGLLLGVRDDKVISVKGDPSSKANEGRLCVKGRYGFKYIHSSDRLKEPLVRRNGELVEAEWNEAIDIIIENFKKYKGNQFAAIASAKCTNEENYLMQKFTRTIMNTNNIDHCARL